VLLVEAEHGQGGENELNALYARRGGPGVEHWLVPGAGHVGGLERVPAAYEDRVIGFLDRALHPAG
jgi:hypothetical protein